LAWSSADVLRDAPTHTDQQPQGFYLPHGTTEHLSAKGAELRLEPHTKLPAGAPNPLDRQNVTVSNCSAQVFTDTLAIPLKMSAI